MTGVWPPGRARAVMTDTRVIDSDSPCHGVKSRTAMGNGISYKRGRADLQGDHEEAV